MTERKRHPKACILLPGLTLFGRHLMRKPRLPFALEGAHCRFKLPPDAMHRKATISILPAIRPMTVCSKVVLQSCTRAIVNTQDFDDNSRVRITCSDGRRRRSSWGERAACCLPLRGMHTPTKCWRSDESDLVISIRHGRETGTRGTVRSVRATQLHWLRAPGGRMSPVKPTP